eukprot:Tbor_TRINITY_DN3813_c0_g1::TRINITY_DN3813_c0_g1_i1::g.5716::m.5716/K17973/NAA25, MDM20; N-terminal acetyltransferase B complex non-catalytic subunit
MSADDFTTRVLNLIDRHDIGAAESTLASAKIKHPGFHQGLKSAEALLKLRQGNEYEAAADAKLLALSSALDDSAAINATAYVLQQTGSHSELIKVYEKAISIMGPDVEESISAHQNLFNTLIIARRYSEVQKHAMQLLKRTGNVAYQYRAIMANIAQVPVDCTDSLLLKISERMLEHLINPAERSSPDVKESKPISPSCLEMYIHVLIQQKKNSDAIAFIKSKNGPKIGLINTRLEYLMKCLTPLVVSVENESEQKKANIDKNIIARAGWMLEPDNWTFISVYIDTLAKDHPGENESNIFQNTAWEGEAESALLKVLDPSTTMSEISVTEPVSPNEAIRTILESNGNKETSLFGRRQGTLEDALTLCHLLQNIEKTHHAKKMRRGPFMAELEILKRTGCKTFKDKVLEYCEYFGTKGVAFLDIAMFLVDRDEDIINSACTAINDKAAKLELSVNAHTLRILSLKLNLLKYPCCTPIPNALEMIKDCLLQYHNSRSLSVSLEWSEEGLTDGYLFVGCNIALRQWIASKKKDRQWLITGLSCLVGVDRKLNNPGLLIMSAIILRELNLCDNAVMHQLDFKSIQFASMHHIGFVSLQRGAMVGDLSTYVAHAAQYFNGSRGEIAALHTKLFEHLAWLKYKELNQFEKDLNMCLSKQEVLILDVITSLMRCQTNKYTVNHVVNKAYVFERVLNTLCESHASEGENKIPGKSDPSLESLVKSIIASAKDKSEPSCSGSLEDDRFLSAYLFDIPNSDSIKDLTSSLFDKTSVVVRQAHCAMLIAAFAILHDVVVISAIMTPKAPCPKVKKGSPIPVPTVNPVAIRDLLIDKWAINPTVFDGLETVLSSSASSAAWCRVFSSMCVVVKKIALNAKIGGNAMNSMPTADLDQVKGALESITMGLKNNSGTCYVALKTRKAASDIFSIMFPVGILFSSLLTVAPPKPFGLASLASAFRDMLSAASELLSTTASDDKQLHDELKELSLPSSDSCESSYDLSSILQNEPQDSSTISPICSYIMQLSQQSVNGLKQLVKDLTTDTEASARRK